MSEIQETAAEVGKIRLLADSEMYSKAVEFAGPHWAIKNNQLAGLRQFSRSWGELNGFIRHQKEKGRDRDLQRFYTALDKALQELRSIAQKKFVPDNLSRRETTSRTDHFAGQLAHAFIQHLAAEIEWQKKGQR